VSHASGIAIVADQLRDLARDGRCAPEYQAILERAITHLVFAEEVARQMDAGGMLVSKSMMQMLGHQR
jgi:hypothetical protein